MLFGTKWAYADQIDPVIRGEGSHCPICGGAIGGLEWLPPYRIKLSSSKPKKWGDFLWGAGFQLMVSHRFRDLYEIEDLQGITKFYPSAEVVRVGRNKIGDIPSSLPKYSLVKIVWNAANLDDVKSDIERKIDRNPCNYCRGAAKSFERVVIENGTWDGSDIFEARGLYGTIVVSERFKDIVDKYHLKNALFIPTEKYAYNESGQGTWYIKE